MAKNLKKALCILLAVLLAFSSFAVSAFAYSGYDQDGPSSDLRVQAVVSTDATNYSVDDTITATVTLNHPDDSVVGYQGFLAFDSSKLEFLGVEPLNGFEFYSETLQPTADSVVPVDPTTLTRGINGDPLTAESFASLLGSSPFSAPAVVNVPLMNLTGLEAGSHAVFQATFKAKAAVSSTRIALVPSIVFSSGLGFLNDIATTSTEGVYETAFAAVSPSRVFKIEGGSADVYYDITFSWNGGSEVVSTKEGTYPQAPDVPSYGDGDYDFSFSGWSPDLQPASAATTYVAQYNSVFVSADYTAYNTAKAQAIAKRDNGTTWTDESVAALNTELTKDVSGKGRTEQSVVDAQTAAIIAAANALTEPAATYEIKFEVNGVIASTQIVSAGETPVAPSVEDYEDNAKTYHFTGWDKEIVPAAANTTYVARFEETWKEYDITFNWHGDSAVVKTHWGDMPVAPTVPGYEDASTTYVFNGWSPELVACAGAATYTATYAESTKTFTIKFVDEDGTTVLKEDNLAYGAEIVPPTDPSKAADNTYTYTFNGWSPAVAATVTKDQTYTATYKATYIDYTITFVTHDGTTSDTYHYDDTVTVPSVSGYADNTFNYTFKGWDKAVTTVQGDTTYTAQYNKTYIDYTVTFKWDNGGSKDVTVHWGEIPVGPSVPSYEAGGKTYSFKNWDPTPAGYDGTVTEYNAVYSSEVIIYNITFDIEGVQSTQQVAAGNMPTVPELIDHADPTDGDYQITFNGWDKVIIPAAGDTTYTAQYSRDFVPADYTAVNNAKAIAAEINRDIYTAESLAVLDSALEAVVEGLGRTKQAQVDAMASAIADAADALMPKPADYTAYNAAVDSLRTELAKPDYTPDSITSVTTKLNTIDNALDKELDITQQGTVDTATAAVNALFDELVIKADKGALKQLIDDANALDAEKYVDFSAVNAALTQAQSVYDDENATNEEVAGAILALRNALNALVMKDADYSAWNALEEQYAAIQTEFYTPESVAAVENVLKEVVKGQNIEYQPTLDALTAQLDTAIKGLELVKSWEGEMDFEGETYEYFYANLEFVQEIDPDDASNIVVKVYLNHPMNQVDGIQIAAIYDAQAMTYKSIEINNGTLIYANTGDASFDPTDFGLDSMGKAGILKFAADFDSVLAPSAASKDLIATLHFTATGAASSSYLKTVPLAANNVPDRSNYSAMIYGDDESQIAESYMHNDAAQIVLEKSEAGTVTGTLKSDNTGNVAATVTVVLANEQNSYTTTTIREEGYSFEGVAPGTYTLTFSALGSLGFTVKNVVVEGGQVAEIPQVYLMFGDADGSTTIAPKDISDILIHYGDVVTEPSAFDVDGDGVISPTDISMVLLADHYGASSATRVLDLAV
ncbi:MAG: carboxypeptidase regulatory-like domain-containing protein [Clostridia bacterium]|nr:carboxypeptidase regulatory-like domain-containing protein [Clostridia bacterium]